MPNQGAGIVDETTLINYAGAGGTGTAPLSNFLDPLVDAADMSLPQGFLIYVFFDEFLNINSQYSGMIQVEQTIKKNELRNPERNDSG